MDPLDLKGLKCPLPALFAKRALVRAGTGAIVEVITDDPMAPIDVPHMCRQEGFEVIETVTDNGVTRMRLRRPE
jgi:tRNA 2-thiouridine synthesizing protein A